MVIDAAHVSALWWTQRSDRCPAGAHVREAALPVFVHLAVCFPFCTTSDEISCKLLFPTPSTGREAEQWGGRESGAVEEIMEEHTRTGHVQTQAKTEVYVRTHTLIKQAHMQAVWITAMRPNATWKRSKGTKKRKKTTQGKLQHKGPEPYQNQDCRFNFIQSALTFPSRARSSLVSAVASTSSRLLGEVKSPAVVRNVPSVHTVHGPERHMNSPERTKPPTYSSSTRRNGCGECVLLFYSPHTKNKCSTWHTDTEVKTRNSLQSGCPAHKRCDAYSLFQSHR